jgi:hypothetical protein
LDTQRIPFVRSDSNIGFFENQVKCKYIQSLFTLEWQSVNINFFIECQYLSNDKY